MDPTRAPSCHIPCNKQTQPCHPQLQRLLCSGPLPPNPNYNLTPCCNFDSRPAVTYTCNLPPNPPTPAMQRNLISQGLISMNRGVNLRTNATDNTGNNEVSVLIDNIERYMSSNHDIIKNHYMTNLKELQEVRKNRDDLSAINLNLKKEITNLKRERFISSKLVEKLKKDNEAEIEKFAQLQTTFAVQREELQEANELTKSQAEKIASLEEKCNELKTKYNELLSSHVDQKVEHLQGQTDLKNLTAKIATLDETVESQKMKIAELSMNSDNLFGENEKLRNQLKIKDLELKAEKLLKEQILKEQIDVLTKPTFLNKMLRQKCEQEQLFNLANMKQDVDEEIPSQEALRLTGNKMSAKRGYDQLLAQVESLKETIRKDDPVAGTSQVYSSSIMKKIRMSSNSNIISPSSNVFSDKTSELDNASINCMTDSCDYEYEVELLEVGEIPEDTQSQSCESVTADDDDALTILPTDTSIQLD